LKEVYLSESTFIVLDCGKEIIGDVLKQAQQVQISPTSSLWTFNNFSRIVKTVKLFGSIEDMFVEIEFQVGMIAEWYFFMLTTLDAHTIDLEDFKVNKGQH
jgi:hypothetical protein